MTSNFKSDNKYFYEGKFKKTRKNNLERKLAFWTYALRRDQMIKKYVDNGMILDLGCGGGFELLSQRGQTIGVDISRASLMNAKKIYGHVVIADIANLPFKENIFDHIVSIDVLGHIPVIKKNKCISEISRCIKETGTTLHYIESDSDNLLTRCFKKYGVLYQAYFIDQDGHYGLEKPREIRERFKKFFNFVELMHGYSYLLPPGEYSKRLNNEYKNKMFFLKLLVIGDQILSFRLVLPISLIILTPIYHILERLHSIDADNGVFIRTLNPKK